MAAAAWPALRVSVLRLAAIAMVLAGMLWHAGGQGIARVPRPDGRSGFDPLGGADDLAGPSGAADVSDLVGFGAKVGTTDVDRSLDPGERRKRMRSCVHAAQSWLETRPDEAETAIAGLLAQAQATPTQAGSDFSTEQAMNQLVFSMTMSCYQSIDVQAVEQVHAEQRLTKEQEDTIFKQSSSPPRPTRKQFRLLESVMKEEQQRRAQEVGPEAIPGEMNIIGSGMSPRAKAAYLLLVLTAFAGGAAYAFPKVLRGKPPRERTAKMQRKLQKVEMMLEKKKRT